MLPLASVPPISPKIKILELTRTMIKFELFGVDLSIANALRRVMISEVPTMAIYFVNVNANTTILHDEYLVHRLGLIPINSMQSDKYCYPRDCLREGLCNECSVKMSLKVKGAPGTVTEVTSADLKSLEPRDPMLEMDEGKGDVVGPAELYDDHGNKEPPILITKINENQELDVDVIITKGIGKEHAKWNPTSTVAMQQCPFIDLNQHKLASLTKEQKQEIVDSCPAKVYRYKPETEKIEIEDLARCMLCQECVKKADSFKLEKAIKVGITEKHFVFTVESNGSLRPDEIVRRAIKELGKKIVNLREAIKDQEPIVSKP